MSTQNVSQSIVTFNKDGGNILRTLGYTRMSRMTISSSQVRSYIRN